MNLASIIRVKFDSMISLENGKSQPALRADTTAKVALKVWSGIRGEDMSPPSSENVHPVSHTI